MVKQFHFLVRAAFIASVLFAPEASAQSVSTSTDLGDAIVRGIGGLFKKKDKDKSKKNKDQDKSEDSKDSKKSKDSKESKKSEDNRSKAQSKAEDDLELVVSGEGQSKDEAKAQSKAEDDLDLVVSGEGQTKEEDDVELIVTGVGPTKEKATLSALRSALEQVYGTMVSSNTKILNDDLVKDEIVSISTGIVKKYTYVSEEEVGGKYYVVIKALVTPQKLITYAKQKGASTELAGATFAANVRIQRLNELNKIIVSANITEMQINILPKCLDFSIINIKEPKHEHFYPRDVFSVEFELRVSLNSNAKIIQDLEKEKSYTGVGGERILKSIYNQFKLEDDINEYIPMLNVNNDQKNSPEHRYSLTFTKKSKDNATNNIYIEMDNFYIVKEATDVFYFMCDSKGEVSTTYRDYPEDRFIKPKEVMWKYATPNRPIISIPMYIYYTLNDLDRITGIKVIPKALSE